MKSLWRKVALGRVYAGVNEGMIRGILKTWSFISLFNDVAKASWRKLRI
jgi:hypothetical protein